MSDIGDDFAALHKIRQEKRASNRHNSADLLTQAGIEFEVKNIDAHLIIKTTPVVDFWPGTGLWMVRGDKTKRRGVHRLISYLKGEKK